MEANRELSMKKSLLATIGTKKVVADAFQLAINTLIALTILVLILFVGQKIYTLFFFPSQQHFIHDLVFLLVLVKIFRLLLSYFKHHRISIQHVVEISIIAPAIELVFASDLHSPFVLGVFLVYSLANLMIYIFFFEKLKYASS